MDMTATTVEQDVVKVSFDCGKQGQFVLGLNGGRSSSNPTWSVDGNTFLYTVDGVVTDQSGSDNAGDVESRSVKQRQVSFTGTCLCFAP